LQGGGGLDRIEGGDGDDVIRGGAGNDNGSFVAYPNAFNNSGLFGGNGNDLIFGEAGNDALYGEAGNDSLNGGDPNSSNPGQGEIDNLSGGTGSDRFILGDSANIYYDDRNTTTNGNNDYALITDFNTSEGDVIQLQGEVSNYRLETSGANTNLYVDKIGSEPDELIAIFQNVTGLNLSSNAFEYVAAVNVDGAGNTLDTARNLGILTGTQTINDSVSNADLKDIFRFQLTDSSDFSLLLNGLTADADVQLLDSSGNLITGSSQEGTTPEAISIKLNPGVYYVEVDNHSGDTEYNLQLTSTIATIAPFQILSVTPDAGSNGGNTTIGVIGNKFTPNATLSLIDANGIERPASQTLWYNDTTLVGTFNLTGLTTGAYDLKLNDTPGTLTKPDIFTINNGTPGQLEVFLSAPDSLRNGQTGTVSVTYRNTGNTDIVAPLLTLAATGGKFQGFDTQGFTATSLQFLGINNQGAAGILSPGETGTISFQFQADNSAVNVNFTLSQIDPNGTIDWAALKDESRPNFIPVDGWDAIWNNFTASVGTTAAAYQAVLAENATRLSQLGEYTPDVNQLLAFELQQASDYGTLSQRYDLGSLGRGGFLPWEVTATPDSDGNVSIGWGSSVRFFERQTDGSYRGSVGDYGTLTLTAGIYQLREKDGTLTVFRPDGKLDYLQDTNNNRLTTTYANNQLTRVTDGSGYSLIFNYNPQGRVSQITDNANHTTTYTYDGTGERLLNITDALNHTTTFTYNPDNSVKSVTNAEGTKAEFIYDSQGQLIQQNLTNGAEKVTYTYDTAGGVTVTDANGAATQLLLNDLGLLSQLKDPLDRFLQFQYDANGNLTRLTAPNNTVSSFTYDNQGNLLSQVDPLGYSVKFTYEPTFNQITSVRDQRDIPTNYSYDTQGNLLAITYVDGSKEQFSYDTRGNVVESVNRRGQKIDYTYNANNELVSFSYANTPQVDFTYSYDAVGNLTSAADQTGTISLDYDATNQLKQVIYPNRGNLKYNYDAAGRRVQMVYPDGYVVNYSYDDAGRLQRLSDGNNQTLITYTYDAVGRLIREDNGNGTYTTYKYDAAGQLLEDINYAPNNSVNSSYKYTYDNLGRRSSMTTLEGTWQYGYDPTGQLTSVTLPTGRTINYTYDGAGNRIQVNDNSATTNYSTNNLNQYTTVGGATYIYDSDGNLITKIEGGQTRTYIYDDQNRLIGTVTPEGTWTYEYDALGNRIASTHNGQRTEYLLDPTGLGDVIGEYDSNGNLTARYIHGIGLVSRLDATNNATYYDFDALGSTVGLTGGSGNYVNTYSYLPFGEDLTKNETVANPFEYVGQWGVMDEGNGLDFMRARFYQPAIGSFTTIDPLKNSLLRNYNYSNNSPTQFIDPSGLQSDPLGNFINGLKVRSDVNYQEIAKGTPGAAANGIKQLEASNKEIRDNSVPAAQDLVTQSISGIAFGPTRSISGAINKFTGVPTNVSTATQNVITTTVPKTLTGRGNPSLINKPFWKPILDYTNNLPKQNRGKSSSRSSRSGGGGGGSWGDPHLTTFDGLRYDLQAAGELTLFKSTTGDLTLQVRQEPVSSPWGGQWVSVNTAVATLIDGNRAGIYVNEAIPLKINGVATDLANGASLALGTGRIERNNELYTLVYPTGDRVDVGLYNSQTVVGNYININPYLADGREGEIVGILGNNNGNSNDDFALPDGTVLTNPFDFDQLYNQFANSWRITQAESLFDYKLGENTSTFTKLDYPSQVFTIADLPADKRAFAEQIGQELGITDPILLANAILDIAITDGDTAFVNGAADQNRLLIASTPTTIIGPAGTGARGWLASSQNLAYQIYFTNPNNATTSVASVTITEQLDSDLDWNTLALGNINIGNVTVTVPQGRQSYTQQVDLRQQIGYFVNISGKLDPSTGQLSWTLQAIDPNTNAPPTTGGFLPPNGQGSVSYQIQSKPGLATETQLTAIASVTLNNETPINTLVYLNTIDAGTPSSSVTALPTTTNNPNFTVAWSGNDDGSGIAFFDIYTSVDGNPFSLWLNDTTATSAVYNGQVGKTYAFYSVAQDNVGYIEAAPVVADTQTTVVTATNNPPVVSNISKSGNEDTIISFATTDFINAFSDVDGNNLIKIEILSLPNNGTLQLSGVNVNLNQEIVVADLNNLKFTPSVDFNGGVSFNWNGFDGTVYAVTPATVNLTINPVNDPPIVSNISKTGNEDTVIPFATTDFTNAFSDVDGDNLNKIKITSLPNNETLQLSGVNVNLNQEIEVADLDKLKFTPSADFNGAVSFNWNGFDGIVYAVTPATVNLTIQPVNDPPIVSNISKSGDEDTVISFATTDFTTAFSDVDGDNLSKIKITSLANNGTLQLSGVNVNLNQEIGVADLDKLKFTPSTNFNGEVSFNWNGFDGTVYAVTPATVNLTIKPVNDPPIARDDNATTQINRSVTIPVLANDSDPEGDRISLISFDSTSAQCGTVRRDNNGTPSDFTDDKLIYTPRPSFRGDDVFNYTISDGNNTSSAKVNVKVGIRVNQPPVAKDDNATTQRNRSVTIPVLANDSDPEGDRISLISFDSTSAQCGTVRRDNNGTPSDFTDDKLIYTPRPSFRGDDVFNYTISDGNNTSSAKVNVKVGIRVNQPPVAKDDNATTQRNRSVTIPVLANDSDPEGDRISLISFNSTSAKGGTVRRDKNGTPRNLTDDKLIYTPRPGFRGNDVFIYTISDGTNTSSANVNVKVGNVGNQPPVAKDDTATATQNTPLKITAATLLKNDTDPDRGDTIKITGVSNPSNGSVELKGNNIIFTPDPGFIGQSGFDYTISDSQGATSSASVNIIVNPFLGTPGRDTLTGTNFDDILIGGGGSDILRGKQGKDQFVYQSIRDRGDIIKDFQVNQDKIVLTSLLDSLGYAGSDPISDGYLKFGSRGRDAVILIDQDGLGMSKRALPFITVENVTLCAIQDPNNFVF
jgi:RHS repeat-associated protein